MEAETTPEQGGLWEQGQGQIQCHSFFGTTSTGSLAKAAGLHLGRKSTRTGIGKLEVWAHLCLELAESLGTSCFLCPFPYLCSGGLPTQEECCEGNRILDALNFICFLICK